MLCVNDIVVVNVECIMIVTNFLNDSLFYVFKATKYDINN